MSGPVLRVAPLAALLLLPVLPGCAAILFAGKVAQTARLVEMAATAARRLMVVEGELPRVAAGQTVTGTLELDDSRFEEGHSFDGWRYEGRAGETVQIDLESDAFDAFLVFGRMVGPPPGTFERIDADDDSGEGTNARLVVTLAETAAYAILATAVEEGSRGPYRLRVTVIETAAETAAAPEPVRAW